MKTLLVLVLLVGCSKKEEPPPDPLGGCAKTKKVFEKVHGALGTLAKHAPDVNLDSYCGKLKAATAGIAFATGGNKVIGPIVTKIDEIAAKCPSQPIEATQKAIADQLGKGDSVVANMCSK